MRRTVTVRNNHAGYILEFVARHHEQSVVATSLSTRPTMREALPDRRIRQRACPEHVIAELRAGQRIRHHGYCFKGSCILNWSLVSDMRGLLASIDGSAQHRAGDARMNSTVLILFGG